MKLRSLCVLTALAVSGTACSHGGGPLDACTLIGPQRAGAILGKTVTTRHVGPEATTAAEPSRCFYSTGSFGGGFLLNVKRFHYSDAKAEARSQMKSSLTEASSTGMAMQGHMTDGPGEAAYVLTMPDATQLNVIDHGVWLVVNINRADSPAIRARLHKLGEAALAGLAHQ